MSYMIVVDVGGYSYRSSVFNAERDSIFNYKLSSTPGDPSQAIVDGIQAVLELFQIFGRRRKLPTWLMGQRWQPTR